jgi:uncharacterized protein
VIAAEIAADISARLGDIEREHRVRIPIAVESGSRAWGFPSPDSDYDCRFIYVPRVDDALSLFQRRDVIETPLTPVFDVNGWELRKAFKLMLKGNAVLLEWLMSPITYIGNADFRSELLAFGAKVYTREVLVHHYLSLLGGQRARYFSTPEHVPLKKMFYALRSTLALRVLRLEPDDLIIPMQIQQLAAKAQLDLDVQIQLNDLIAQKATTGELGDGPLPQAFARLMDEEAGAASKLGRRPDVPSPEFRAVADELYRALLDRFTPT